MRRLAAMGAVVATVVLVRQIGGPDVLGTKSAALAFGFALIASVLTGDLAHRFGLPRLTGYLFFGLACGPALANLITAAMARELQVINGVALAVIGLIAGLELNFDRLLPRLGAISRFTLVTVGVMLSSLAALVWAAWPWLPILPDATGALRLGAAFTVAAVVATSSPIVVISVIADSRARGRLAELTLATTVLANLLLVAVFAVAVEGVRWSSGAAEPGLRVVAVAVWAVTGSLAFGALVGAIFALYMREIGRELTIVLLAACAVLGVVSRALALEPILASIAAGFVVTNAARPQGDALRVAIARGSLPVLVVFFAAAGASIDVGALAEGGALAIGLVLVRFGLLRLGTDLGARVAGLDDPLREAAWTGFISQAGISLGLAAAAASEFPDWGTRLQTLTVAIVAVHEIVGPIAFKAALSRLGEIGPAVRRSLIVVSNREPYTHTYREDGSIHCPPAAGGVAVALDALMRERGGTWIAHGSGNADRAVVDAHDHVQVPPDQPIYTLRRQWIDDDEFARYYGGFANEGLWPLCHVVDVRPAFRAEDWASYQRVNAQFAAAIDEELRDHATAVFIQDYHMALVAPELRRRRPDARTALFWHIPWPSPDRLRVCPWRKEIVQGLLANDFLAFQVERDRRNFVMAAVDELGAELEYDTAVVRHAGRRTTVVAVPIGVDFDRIQAIGSEPAQAAERERLVEALGPTGDIIGVGVDRLDYTKGIPERLAALDRLFGMRPALRGRLTFVQIGVPSRSELESYSAIESEIDQIVESINQRHGMHGLAPPIIYRKEPLPIETLVVLYRLASFCIVSSLHDGMNLVAKEFVASREDQQGVLVLSELAGAAQELGDALMINPYDIDGFARALSRAIDMPLDEQGRRMRSLRRIVAGRNVFDWASDILEGLDSLWSRPLLYSSSVNDDRAA